VNEQSFGLLETEASKISMKRNLISDTFNITVTLVLCLSFLSGCSKSGHTESPREMEIFTGDKYCRETSVLNTSTDEIKPWRKETTDLSEHYDLVLPGRATTSAEFLPGTPGVISLEGSSLFVPEGGLKEKKILSVTGLLNEDLPPIPEEIFNVTRGYYSGYRFLPHGTLFNSNVTVAILYDENLIPAGYTSDDIYTFYFDEEDEKWKTLDRDSVAGNLGMIYSVTSHFTDMINGIIMIPESPQTEGFVPTYMKDIKEADPAAGITLIEPPVANNEGNAGLSYPIILPKGRMGMEPQVTLQYSSDLGSGWTGFGWALDMPSVSVDPAWGVPHYLSDKESETYLFAGTQLTPVAHRSDYSDRTPEKRFYSRVEDEFSRIIRHGSSPADYWWEITQKNGIRNCYGGLPGTGVIADAVSMDAAGRIGYWALVETRDLHDNFVIYKYDKPVESDQQIYIREITYTGQGTGEGPYKITFLRTDPTNSFNREDSRIYARLGFIQRDNQLLRRINVSFNDDLIRSYVFNYRNGEFAKSLLESLTELNSSGKEFYTHKFTYHNDIQQNGGVFPYLADTTWNVPDDGLKAIIPLNPVNFFFSNVSALGGSGSLGGSGKVTGTVGFLDGNLSTKNMTAGGNATFQNSTNEGFLTLVDLNGDGLPDKVYRKDGKVYYRKNLLSYPSDRMFGDEKLINGISNISYSKSLGFGGGIEVNPYSFFVGSAYNTVKTKTSAYFTDFNGDGLIDLVDNSVVYFNHPGPDGVPIFETTSSNTPNPLYANSDIDLSILPDPVAEQAQLEAQFPLHDAVRMWQAPFTGIITVNAPVQLVEDISPEARKDNYKDGVIVSIQQNGNFPVWTMDIDSGDYTSYPGPPLNPISVSRGDRLFFRVQSKFNGSYDKVYWDPLIEYSSINGSDALIGLEDNNGKIISRFKASEDFVLCGEQSVGLPEDGEVRVRASFSKQTTSDSLELLIVYTDSAGARSELFHSVFDCEANNASIDSAFEVTHDGFLQFRIISSTSVDWSSIKFFPRVEYTRIDNDSIPLTDTYGNPVLFFRTLPGLTSMYNDPVRQELPIITDSAFIASNKLDTVGIDLYRVKATPLISKIIYGDTVRFILSVKERELILGKAEYKYLNGIPLAMDTIFADVNEGDTIFFDYNISNIGYMTPSDTAFIIFGSDSTKTGLASVFSPVRHEDEIFGHLYRGWGQFDYKGDEARATSPIDVSLLKVNYKAVDIGAISDTSGLGGIENPLGEIFNMMVPYAPAVSYMGTDDEIFVSQLYVSSSRLGEKNVKIDPIVLPASGVTGVTKVSTSSSVSVSAGLSKSSISHTWGYDNVTVDMMDMNGDRYPDLLTTGSIQYTGINGAISGKSVSHQMGDHYAISEATALAPGGNFANAKSSNSLTTMPAKGVKVIIGDNFKTNNNAREAKETSQSSLGLSASISFNDDHTDQTWLDINGDGLPDKIYANGQVRLNLGYSFAPAETWNFNAVCTGKNVDVTGGLGVNISNGSIIAGIGISQTFNYATEKFMDINSDGLPDLVNGTNVFFNTGSGFASPVAWPGLNGDWPGTIPLGMMGVAPLDAGESIGESVEGGFTIGIAIPILFIKICINPSGSVSHGVSRTLTQLADINGDGMADFLSSGSESELKVKASTIFRTNMLKQVDRPLGGSFSLDYLLTPAIYEHPGGKLALASVKVYDGLTGDGVDTTLNTFDYTGGYYDRHERQFYGFYKVRTDTRNTADENTIYRSLIQEFCNSDYYRKGKLLAETLVDGAGRNQKGLRNKYSLRNIHTGDSLDPDNALSDREPEFVALEETERYYYAGASQHLLTSRVTYEYDTLGNISAFNDFSSGKANDWYSVTIVYHHDEDKYNYSVPSLQEVSTIEGVKRRNQTEINEHGDITRITKNITGDQTAQIDIEYDQFGNLTKITRPVNYKGERMWYEYDYDQVVHSYVTGITDAYGYTSSSVYDYKWGMPVEITDMNGQKLKYSIDDYGRVDTITGPYELAAGRPYTIAFEYFPEADVPYSHTIHYDSLYDSGIETYSFWDGLRRRVQVKKTAALFEQPDADDRSGYIVSGKVLYNAFGHPESGYHPVFEPDGNPGKYNENEDNVQPTKMEYDVQDRIKKVTLPDGSFLTHSYNIGNFNGETMHIDSLTDALNNISVTYAKANGKKGGTVRKSGTGDIITYFGYNGAGELVSITDPMGNISTSEYDMLGRRLTYYHPDAGLTEFRYDGAGNLTEKITASLRKQIPDGGAISYKYDRERLTEIVYPRNIQNRVNYKYGEPGAPFNRAGRIELQQDASGGQEFFYSRLGDVIKTIRTVQLGESDSRSWIWSAEFDTWNRVRSMIYPDGEKVNYLYNRAGNLMEMHGEKLGRTYDYVSRIGYNKFEKQVYTKYGNGTETVYEFEPKLQRLKLMNVTSGSSMIMDNEYSYDLVGNILEISNSAVAEGKIGGTTSNNYSYNELYRLTSASGEFNGLNTSEKYSLSMQYDLIGKILHKEQIHSNNNEDQAATTYDLFYKYGGVQPSAATEIGERLFSYDANGNLKGWQDTVTNDYRLIAWDEENRLTMVSDNGYMSRYVYDASGNRVIKSHGGTQGIYIDGAPVGVVNSSSDNYTVYVNPFFVFQNEKFTKHYYNGTARVCSKTGNGQFMNQYRPGVFEITAGKVNYIERQQKLLTAKQEFEKLQTAPPGPPTLKGIYTDPLFSGIAYPDPGTPESSPPRSWPRQPVFAPEGGPPGAPVKWSGDITNENVNAGFGFTGNGNFEEVLRYFYHSDHLGSVSYITNSRGEPTQFISYLPFGEVFAEQHNDWDSPYKFNAKELDVETGLYFYGARYYDPKVSSWLSVDPLLEEFTGSSPYIYCENNPVIYLDPDGRKLVLHGTGEENRKLLESLQKVAGGRFDYNVKTGEVFGFSSPSSDKSPGARQIRELIDHRNTINVGFSTDKITGFAPRENELQNAWNGTGISEGTININQTESFELLVQDPSGRQKWEKASLERTIVHENEHALRALKGQAVDYNEKVVNQADRSKVPGGKIAKEEREVMDFENTVFPKSVRQRYTPREGRENLPAQRR
jgi:RHS repeat-associated protein